MTTPTMSPPARADALDGPLPPRLRFRLYACRRGGYSWRVEDHAPPHHVVAVSARVLPSAEEAREDAREVAHAISGQIEFRDFLEEGLARRRAREARP